MDVFKKKVVTDATDVFQKCVTDVTDVFQKCVTDHPVLRMVVVEIKY